MFTSVIFICVTYSTYYFIESSCEC